MVSFITEGIRALKGTLRLRGDKSIAHRALILAALAEGTTTIRNFPSHDDALSTLHSLQSLGVKINSNSAVIVVYGRGFSALVPPSGPLDVNESGTTLRLLLGVLAGQPFHVCIKAAPSLSRRPMLRVIKPLRAMGVNVCGRRCGNEEYAPISITGGVVQAITYKLPVASAQVKSAILLAGLYAKGTTKVIEPIVTRDHTERMLRRFGIKVKHQGHSVCIKGPGHLISPGSIYIPADISSAAFFIVAASLLGGSRLVIKDVSLNPTRTGIINVLRQMGARVDVREKRLAADEPYGDIIVQHSNLHGVTVQQKDIPLMIDELPVIMVAACFAHGTTKLKGVQELRAKETDRIRSMVENLSKMGAYLKDVRIKGREDIIIRGSGGLHGATVSSYADHRTAMAMIVAGLCATGRTYIDDVGCISKSFPDFLNVLKLLMVK